MQSPTSKSISQRQGRYKRFEKETLVGSKTKQAIILLDDNIFLCLCRVGYISRKERSFQKQWNLLHFDFSFRITWRVMHCIRRWDSSPKLKKIHLKIHNLLTVLSLQIHTTYFLRWNACLFFTMFDCSRYWNFQLEKYRRYLEKYWHSMPFPIPLGKLPYIPPNR